jgi:hypothetical protein
MGELVFNLPAHDGNFAGSTDLATLEFVRERSVVAPLHPALPSLPLPCLYQVLEASAAHDDRIAALGAFTVSRSSQLIFPLPADGQMGELVENLWAHTPR